MTRLPLVSLSFAAMTLFAVVPAVQADLVLDVTKFTGTITDVGVVRGPGQTGGVEYRIRGEFKSTVNIDLRNSTFTIEKFFAQHGSPTGELMRQSQGLGLPSTDPFLTLQERTLAVSQGDADDATYDSPGRFRPQIRVKVEKDEDDEDDGTFNYKFDVRLDRGMMRVRPDPTLCFLESDKRIRTGIDIRFTITDKSDTTHPMTVSFTKLWECSQPDRYHLRSR